MELVNVATELLAKTLAIENSYAIPYSKLKELLGVEIDKHLGNNSPSEYFNFLDALIKEGVLEHILILEQLKKMLVLHMIR